VERGEAGALRRKEAMRADSNRRWYTRILRDESGQAMVLATMCLSLLMAGMALAVDVGNIHYRERQLQTAADAAAIAAGLEIGNCGNTACTNMNTAAEKALIEDGITASTITPTDNQCTVSNSTGLTMIINVGPCILGSSDPNNGNSNMAEVVLTEQQNTIFSTVFGIKSMKLVARSEAGEAYIQSASTGGNCIYTQSLAFNSSDGTFTLNNCGIFDNGNLQTDNDDSVKASTFLYYGTWSPNNCNNSCTWTLGDSETQPAHTTTSLSDPLASLAPPTKPANSTTASDTTPNSGATLQPGYYPNGVNLNSNVSITLAAGLYYMNGSINVDNGATISGSGVELYFVSGGLQLNSGSTAQLTAPTTTSSTAGTTAGMLVWQSSTNSNGMDIDSGSTSYFNGVIYLPDATLTLNSGGTVTLNSSATYTDIDANSIIVDSGENFEINGSGGYLGTTSNPPTLGTFAVAE
jgi:Flp pilus assembly protein TadG